MKPPIDIAATSLVGAGPLLQLSGIYDLSQVSDPTGDVSGAIAAAGHSGAGGIWNLVVMVLLGSLGALKVLAPTIHEKAIRKSAAQAAAIAERQVAAAREHELEVLKLKTGAEHDRLA